MKSFDALSIASDTAISCGARYSNSAAGTSSYYIINCEFQSLSSSSNGAAAYLSGSTNYLNVNYSYFINCTTTSTGGAIYFSGGSFNISHVCAVKCSATSYGAFTYSSASSYIVFDYLSTSKCADASNPIGSYSIDYAGGRIELIRFNLSDNHVATYGSCLSFYSTTFGCLKFGSIIGSSSSSAPLDLYSASSGVQIFYSNIFNNSGTSIFHSSMNLQVSYCSITRNNCSYIFECCAGTFSVFDCFIECIGAMSSGAVYTMMNYVGTTQTLDVPMVGCFSESDFFTFSFQSKCTGEFFFLSTFILN